MTTGLPLVEPYVLPGAGELPAAVAPWHAEPDRAVLLVHDMQNYFLRALPQPLRQPLVHNIARLRENCAALGVPVAYTAQPGDMSDADRGLLKDFWGPGMTGDTGHRAVTTELAPGPDDWVFTKWRYSAFFRSGLLARMRGRGRDQLILCGVYAHLGVLMTAVDAFSNDIETFLVADAVADFSAARHRMALDHAARSCAVVTTVEEVLA
ncbi:isochorismatase family protein [Streptomyces aurantiacus]|uniref:isochorismatase family protein n=1 Tax=Streptomyces aurantiacus TaxID=47760 RepID=UPI0006E28866|nr:isochorismatase family protein [Streptomyces aurantiacus]